MDWAPVTDFKELVSDGAGNVDLDIGPVPEGLVWVLNHVAAEDETTAFTELRVGIVRGLSFVPLESHQSPAAGVLYFSPDPWYVQEGEFIRARFKGSLLSDKLHLRVNGRAVSLR